MRIMASCTVCIHEGKSLYTMAASCTLVWVKRQYVKYLPYAHSYVCSVVSSLRATFCWGIERLPIKRALFGSIVTPWSWLARSKFWHFLSHFASAELSGAGNARSKKNTISELLLLQPQSHDVNRCWWTLSIREFRSKSKYFFSSNSELAKRSIEFISHANWYQRYHSEERIWIVCSWELLHIIDLDLSRTKPVNYSKCVISTQKAVIRTRLTCRFGSVYSIHMFLFLFRFDDAPYEVIWLNFEE